MFELPDMENVVKVTVDKAAVKGASEPIITYGKNHQHQLLNLNLFLEINRLMSILSVNESIVFKATITT